MYGQTGYRHGQMAYSHEEAALYVTVHRYEVVPLGRDGQTSREEVTSTVWHTRDERQLAAKGKEHRLALCFSNLAETSAPVSLSRMLMRPKVASLQRGGKRIRRKKAHPASRGHGAYVLCSD